ncbi:exodeoxyribonuclease V subunit beta [Limnohabitans sp. B9-3]|uniref:exodeoxyribonuclease V subunit beta n=1 Tax=Limnohabitans sp. B9-3 TaxID=1100707 RepID=UPI000C1F5D13|nr:exodeoxyribonuclease V subunit beta [Limnohabitans sp. B9-3]PIT78600.1 exodeoxyribonuclease V subunit beta [Limnohabitans sp. B9-3]
MKTLNPLTLPLQGRQVIEASAGTGKTWTLAALYLRLVLGHERTETLLPPQILVMTFTDAATAELRERIRSRLSQAATYFDLSAQNRPLPERLKVDGFLVELRDSFDEALWPRCALQLNCAAEWMDDAAIYTIHGWSRRMLMQHALESQNLFEQTRLENANELKLTLVQDYWRAWFYPLPADTLKHITPLIGQDPDQLLKTLSDMWREQERTPRAVAEPITNPFEAVAAHMAWQAEVQTSAQAARQAWSEAVLHALQDAGAQKKIKGLRADYFANWLKVLQAWATQSQNASNDKEDRKVLERFTTQALHNKGWPEAEGFAFFAAVADHIDTLDAEPSTTKLIALHAAHAVGEAYKAAKTQRAAFDFSDLLQNLHHAVMADDGRLATAIRQQYPVALVDEFQDTDPWQYGTLNRIYAPEACSEANALVMIGDPKQAIYSFRGADLGTYLQARTDAQTYTDDGQKLDDALHTLTGNHRSSEGLVQAVNHVFMQTKQPFASAQGEIAFVEVTAQGQQAPLVVNGAEQPPFTVWQMHPEGESDTVSIGSYLSHTAAVFADQMARLLNAQAATPGDMAVLVRSQAQADAVRGALRARHIPSVYLSDHTSVYQSPEATDLWRLLRAVASPRQTAWVRAAVGSRLWALDLQEVLATTQDEASWERLLDQFHQWHALWQQHGVLPMLHQWLHGQHVAQRVLAQPDGDRRLSNLLHLGELLQHAAQSLQGEHALVRYLGEQIQSPHHDNDTQQARLETDALCVKVITYHKSKGLQYPLVFVPFAGAFGVEKKAKTNYAQDDEAEDDSDPTASSVEEDMRLLYVALTRAQRGLWLGVAETKSDVSGNADKGTLKRSALSLLLDRQTRGDLGPQLHTLWGPCPHIQVAALPEVQHIAYQAPAATRAAQDARTPTRTHHSLWWTASFSAITRGLVSESKRDEAVADAITDAKMDDLNDVRSDSLAHQAAAIAPELAPDPDSISPWQTFPAGARYGTLLHDLLDWLSQNEWPVAEGQAPAWAQQAWADLLARKASWLQLDDAQSAQLTPWLQAVVQTPLPLHELNASPLTLGQLKREHMWPEMEFNLEVSHVPATVLDRHIQAHVFEGSPRPALQARVMQGMLTGSLDLVLQHDGRYWVVDYKSNKLPNYDSATLQDAVLHKRYDVQYVLYTLSLHRLLKVRLPNYDYDQHMGGAIYMFLRGIHTPGAGVHLHRPQQALIEALDALFANGS